MGEKKSVSVTPNSNFNSLNGSVMPDTPSEEYIHYRQCWGKYPRSFTLRELPMHLDLEASSRCNLNCSFCDRRPVLGSGQTGDMDFELFRHIMDQFDETHRLWGVKFSYRGEPLLNKNIPRMVRYAKGRGVLDIYFNTNAMFLTEEMSEALIDAGLDRISISIDGTNKEDYERVRVGANYERLVDNIETLLRCRNKSGTAYPKIRIQTVKLPGIDAQMYQRTWGKYADEVAMLEYTDESRRETGIRAQWACPQLWQRMTIEWDGSVFGCNNDDLRGIYLGNAAERSIYDCWHDERLMEIREAHKNGLSHTIEDCNGCPWRTAQIEKERDR